MNPKNVKLRYVCLNSGNVFDNVDLDTFYGLEVKYCYNRISTIIERTPDVVLTKISFRPTVVPVIQTITCNDGYVQERYNNNVISREYRLDNSGDLQGEAFVYHTNGQKATRIFSHNGIDVNPKVQELIGYEPLSYRGVYHDDWVTYNIPEDAMFNLMVRYGTEFKFYDEYKRENNTYSEMIDYCINK